MGSKSIRYEVLVCPSTTSSSAFKEQQHQQSTSSPLSTDNDSSSNLSATMFETEVQRFTCDRENMQQYWIPEGFHPVLIPRAYLTNSLVATSNNNNTGHLLNGNVIHQLRSRLNNNDNNINDIELRRRRNNVNNNNHKNSTSINGGGITKKRRRNNINNNVNANRRTVLGQSPPTVNINNVINRQRIKERISAMRNSAVSITSSSTLKNLNNPSDRSPSIIIGEMWKDEPENIKKHYERLAIRKKIAQALAFEQKFSSSPSFTGKSNVHVRSTTTTSTSRHNHVNLPICPTTGPSYRFPVHSNVVEGVTINGSSFENSVRQNVDNSVNFSPSSSPIISNDSSRQTTSDWMTRSDNDSYYDENDENSGEVDNSTIITSA